MFFQNPRNALFLGLGDSYTDVPFTIIHKIMYCAVFHTYIFTIRKGFKKLYWCKFRPALSNRKIM